MTMPHHHVTDELMQSYLRGAMPAPFAVVVATHISLCDECRAAWEAHAIAGGVLLEELEATPLSSGAKERAMSMLDSAAPPPDSAPILFPEPLRQALGHREPKWRRIAPGSRQAILQNDAEGSLRLLEFPAGQAVPEHSHGGQEMTLVLQGSFSDVTGTYGVGDVQIADDTLEHAPTADEGLPCICLAATDAPLRFKGLIPRLLQPILRI